MEQRTIYEQIGSRTDGNVYLGVVGPVRTGKSTFVKRMMEELVIPNIENIYRKERARDELPQSGSGKTIMTSEPKFVPEEAVEISPDGKTTLSVRLIDSVGYMVEGAIGAMEDGEERMVQTPWFDYAVPMSQAAELGTRKVMEDHATIGLVVTTDGSITDIPREEYVQAEAKAIRDMKATGKPFLVLVNSVKPDGRAAKEMQEQIRQTYGVSCVCADCLRMSEEELNAILTGLLYAFPVTQLWFYMPKWVQALETDHKLKGTLYEVMRQSAQKIHQMGEAELVLEEIGELECVSDSRIRSMDPGSGIVSCELIFPETLFYQILGEKSGFPVSNDRELLDLLQVLAQMKKEYDKVSDALEKVRATGYGVVMPVMDELHLEKPEVVKKGANYGIRLRASAPSIHMMRANIETELNPMVGDEKQSEDLMHRLLEAYEENPEKLWESNIFGKSLHELVNEGLETKLKRMPESTQFKLQQTLGRMINEGSGAMICILL